MNKTTLVYWDVSDPQNIGWAWRTDDESGPLSMPLGRDDNRTYIQMVAAKELGIDADTIEVCDG